MASPSDHCGEVMAQACTAAGPARLRSPSGFARRTSVDPFPSSPTKLALSTWASRFPTGRLPPGTPAADTGVPASRLAHALCATSNGASVLSPAAADDVPSNAGLDSSPVGYAAGVDVDDGSTVAAVGGPSTIEDASAVPAAGATFGSPGAADTAGAAEAEAEAAAGRAPRKAVSRAA